MEIFDLFENKRRQAIDILVKLGVASYLRELNLYHGRAGDGSAWEIDPRFDNADNNTGNRNVYKVSGIYASEKSIAEQFASARAYNGKTPEVHKIVGVEENAIVFNLGFNISTLTPDQMKEYRWACSVLGNFGITRNNPIKFEHRGGWDIAINKFKEVQARLKTQSLSRENAESIIAELAQDSEIRKIFYGRRDLSTFVYDVIGAYNAKILVSSHPLFAIKRYIKGATEFEFSNIPNQVYPINSSYLSAWCSANHVVGAKTKVDSATLNKTIDTWHLFDVKKIMTEKQQGNRLQNIIDKFGVLSQTLRGVVDEDSAKFLSKASSKEVMEYICLSEPCKKLYDKKSYIKEGWTVGQHTQAVLEFFDRYYSHDVPEVIKPFVKIVLLAHDIGKGFAKEKGISQEEGNSINADKLYNLLNVPDNFRKLVDFVINESQKFTTAIVLKEGPKKYNINALSSACVIAFKKSFGRLPCEKELEGLKEICIMLQSCDSGAYTRYAEVYEGNKMVAGMNDNFTASFLLNQRGDPRLKEFEREDL